MFAFNVDRYNKKYLEHADILEKVRVLLNATYDNENNKLCKYKLIKNFFLLPNKVLQYRAVVRSSASDTRYPRFESSQRQFFYYQLYQLSRIDKTKIKEKRLRMAHLFKV